jgi:hypothetical protein
MLRALLVAASIGATALYGLMQPERIATVLAHAAQWDGKHVRVAGTLANLEERTAMDGREYDAFDLCNAACVHEGQTLTVQGTFSSAKHIGDFDFQNDIETDQGSL